MNNSELKPEILEPKKNYSWKNVADTTATTLWLSAIGFTIYKTGMFRPKNPENILYKAEKIQRKYSKLENMTQINEENNLSGYLNNTKQVKGIITEFCYKTGEKLEQYKTRIGDELYNNLINSLGKLVIMPLIICASPVGDKKSSSDEKISIVIREPLSVLATFTLQSAFDKIFNIYMPKILESNMFESEAIRKKYQTDGKLSVENFDDIKYNPKETKRLFVELANVEPSKGGLKGIISEDIAQKLITLDAFETSTYESYIRNFDKNVRDGGIPKEYVDIVRRKFTTVANSVGNYELAKIKPKIAMNIIVVVILSRIFLNVIHGKSVKLLHLEKEQNNEGGKND